MHRSDVFPLEIFLRSKYEIHSCYGYKPIAFLFMNENEFFRTEDFPLAISLACLGFSLEAIDKTAMPGRSAFVFCHSQFLDETVEKFWKETLRVEPKAFFSASRYLKQHLHREH